MTDNVETTQPVQENTSATDYLESLKGDIEGVKEDVKSKSEKIDRSAKMAERLERVFRDEADDSNLSDDEKDARFLKQFKEAAEADKKAGGSGLPLTTRLAEENAELKKQMREIPPLATSTTGTAVHWYHPLLHPLTAGCSCSSQAPH